MKVNQNIMLAAIALVVSGSVTLQSATMECERIADALNVNDDATLRTELQVYKQCVEICQAEAIAKSDMEA